jgi:hypothetical protein
MKPRDSRLAGLGRTEIARAIGPALAPAGTDQDDGIGRDITVRRFPRGDVGLVDAIVGARIGLPRHVDDQRRPHQLTQRQLVGAVFLFDEMDRRVEMGAAMFRGRIVVRGVVVTRGHALRRDDGQVKGLRRRPVDGCRVERVRQVDPVTR